MATIDNIKDIIDSILGAPKNDYGGSGGWYEYNCPRCADENGGEVDGKHNLAVKLSDDSAPFFHCWKCGYSGKLRKLVRENGSSEDYSEFKDVFKAFKESGLYALFGTEDSFDESFDEEDLKLPEGFRTFDKPDSEGLAALEYLHSRGIGDSVINRFSIGYVGVSNDWTVSRRIVIPSYDRFGDLNYWVARDYTGKSRYKVKNCDVEKKSIVFNEGMVNWYEDITLVEGPFDHLSVPNSIPLLGKTIDGESYVYRSIAEKAYGNVNIFLDEDAFENAVKAYKFLDGGLLNGRVRLVECPKGMDAADIYAKYGFRGISRCLSRASRVDEYELSKY